MIYNPVFLSLSELNLLRATTQQQIDMAAHTPTMTSPQDYVYNLTNYLRAIDREIAYRQQIGAYQQQPTAPPKNVIKSSNTNNPKTPFKMLQKINFKTIAILALIFIVLRRVTK